MKFALCVPQEMGCLKGQTVDQIKVMGEASTCSRAERQYRSLRPPNIAAVSTQNSVKSTRIYVKLWLNSYGELYISIYPSLHLCFLFMIWQHTKDITKQLLNYVYLSKHFICYKSRQKLFGKASLYCNQ